MTTLSVTAPSTFFRYLVPVLPICAIVVAEIIELGFQKNKKFSKFMLSCLGEISENEEDLFSEDDYDEDPSELNFDRY